MEAQADGSTECENEVEATWQDVRAARGDNRGSESEGNRKRAENGEKGGGKTGGGPQYTFAEFTIRNSSLVQGTPM